MRVDLLVHCLQKSPLLAKGSDRRQAGQSFRQVRHNGPFGQALQSLQFPVIYKIKQKKITKVIQ